MDKPHTKMAILPTKTVKAPTIRRIIIKMEGQPVKPITKMVLYPTNNNNKYPTNSNSNNLNGRDSGFLYSHVFSRIVDMSLRSRVWTFIHWLIPKKSSHARESACVPALVF